MFLEEAATAADHDRESEAQHDLHVSTFLQDFSLAVFMWSARDRWLGLKGKELSAAIRYESRFAQIPVATSRQADSEGAMEARDLVRQLFEAALYGRLADLQDIAPQVSTSGLSSVKDGNGRNALHFAAQGGQVETASYLIVKEGIDEDSQDEQGELCSQGLALQDKIQEAKYIASPSSCILQIPFAYKSIVQRRSCASIFAIHGDLETQVHQRHSLA